MIPPPPRECGDAPRNAHEQVEEALVYIFEVHDHEGSRLCGASNADPSRVLCCRCIARNALMNVGWTLNPREETIERKLGFLGGDESEPEPLLGAVNDH